MKKFFSSIVFWYRFREKSVYTILLIVVVFCLVISFSLCLYLKLKRKNRRFDDNYEYTRLHDSSFGFGITTEGKCRHQILIHLSIFF